MVRAGVVDHQYLIKEFLAVLLRGKRCERSELPFESRACSGVHTFDFLRCDPLSPHKIVSIVISTLSKVNLVNNVS